MHELCIWRMTYRNVGQCSDICCSIKQRSADSTNVLRLFSDINEQNKGCSNWQLHIESGSLPYTSLQGSPSTHITPADMRSPAPSCARSNMGDWLVTDLAPKFGALGVRRQDIMVLNFAIWVNVADEYAGNLAMWADYYRRHKAALPFVLWRDASVQHFDTPTGAPALALPNSAMRHCWNFGGSLLHADFIQATTHDGWRESCQKGCQLQDVVCTTLDWGTLLTAR